MRWPTIKLGGKRKHAAWSAWEGEPVDVDRYWAEAWAELNQRSQILSRKLGLGDSRWTVDQNSGLIQFDRRDGALVSAPVQIIGAWNPRNETFTWAWDHPSVRVRLRASAERTRWFGDKHGLPELTAPCVRASESEAWGLTAVAMKVNAAVGAYRAPTEGPVIFLTMGDFKVVNR
ncbi:MAG: DUF6882 domain-containing protein [Hyphomonadaceae bacterium]